jgi:sensor domain CHASE-containing protein
MFNSYLLLVLFFGGFIGWALAVTVIITTTQRSNVGLKIIKEIQNELIIVKEKLKDLK